MRPPYGPTRIDRPQFLKAYPEWIDGAPLPGGYKTPFITFSGEDKQSTVEHLARFLCQIGEAAGQDHLRIKLFPNSLTGVAFTWFANLPTFKTGDK